MGHMTCKIIRWYTRFVLGPLFSCLGATVLPEPVFPPGHVTQDVPTDDQMVIQDKPTAFNFSLITGTHVNSFGGDWGTLFCCRLDLCMHVCTHEHTLIPYMVS